MNKYIDARVAFKVLSDYYHHKTPIQHMALSEALDRVPAADVVEARHGKWLTKTVKKFCDPDCWYPGIFEIEDSWNEEEGSWLEEQEGFCSECGEYDEHYGRHKYCPHCGAKMEEDEHEHDE